MKISIHIIPQMTTEALEDAYEKEIQLQQSRPMAKQNWKIVNALADEIDRRTQLGVDGPIGLEDYLG